MSARSHVREALAQLRRWVPIAGGVVGVASLIQLLVFGFVHFTDIRWQQLRDDHVVVQTSASTSENPVQFQTQWELAQRKLAGEYAPPPDVNKVRSGAGVAIERASQTAVFMGVVGVVGLVSLTLLGCVIAGGGGVPGVDKVLGAAVGAMLLGVASIPWNEAFASVPIAGVFTGYHEMTVASDSARGASSISLIAMHVVVPLCVLVGAAFIVLRFNAGVEEGFILEDASDADAALDREVARIERQGVGSNRGSGFHVSRSIGAAAGVGERGPVKNVSRDATPDAPSRRPL